MATAQAHNEKKTIPSGANRKFGVAVSDFNTALTERLLDGCLATLKAHQVTDEQIHIVHVPGAFELPMGARQLLSKDRLDAIICLGCIIKGETRHDEYISQAVANGIMQLSLMSNTPVVFGVLTTETFEQAEARAGGKYGNKGIEAAEAALQMADLRHHAGTRQPKIGFA